MSDNRDEEDPVEEETFNACDRLGKRTNKNRNIISLIYNLIFILYN